MSATTTRKEALERICKTFHDALERMILADENQRLSGNTFRDFDVAETGTQLVLTGRRSCAKRMAWPEKRVIVPADMYIMF